MRKDCPSTRWTVLLVFFPLHVRGKNAIAAGLVGEQLEVGAGEVKVGVVAQKGFDEVFVFFRFEGAGAVREDAARGYEPGRAIEEGALQAGEDADIRFSTAPAQVRMVAEDAQAGTGRVYEHAVK